MTRPAVALAVRTRGLAMHLLSRAALEGALRTPDLSTLQRHLAALGLPVEAGATARPEALELAVRRWAAGQLASLERWLPERPELGAIVAIDEDRRSVRAMVRGAAAGAGVDQRLAGLIPTPALGERSLRELARQADAARIAALLVRWRHPLGSALLDATRSAEPDLLAVERTLHRAAFELMRTAAERVGGATADAVAEQVDVENARLVLWAVARGTPDVADASCLAGGRLPGDVIRRAAHAHAPLDALERLGTGLPAPVRDALGRGVDAPEQLDGLLAAARLRRLRSLLRRDPADPAVVLLFALRLRVQVMLLQLAIWRLVLGSAPVLPEPLLEAA